MPPLPRYRMPAEWARHEATWVGWPQNPNDWPGKLGAVRWAFTELVRHIARSETVHLVVADAGYGYACNYAELEGRGCVAVIPSQAPSRHPGGMPAWRFKRDERHDVVRCPGGAKLRCCRENAEGVTYKARVSDCARCRFRERCVPAKSKVRSVLMVHGHASLVRARRAQFRGEIRGTRLYSRRFFLAEGLFAWAKREFGLCRAARRGLWTVTIQAHLAFVAMNLRKLGAYQASVDLWARLCGLAGRIVGPIGWMRRLCNSFGPATAPAAALAA